MTTSSGTVLLVEDNTAHAVMVRRAFKMAGLQAALIAVESGDEAIEYLQSADGSTVTALPDLILLDWQLPGMSGLELLHWIRGQQAFKSLPVVVLTVSSSEEDVSDALLAGADSYLVKPVAFGLLVDLVERLNLQWLRPTGPSSDD